MPFLVQKQKRGGYDMFLKKNDKKEAITMKKENISGVHRTAVLEKNDSRILRMFLWSSAFMLSVFWLGSMTVFAADIWGQGSTAAQNVYTNVCKIATPVAGASFVLLKLFSLFTHNPRKLDESRELSKKIVLSWALILGAGYLFTYAQELIGTGGTMTFESATLINPFIMMAEQYLPSFLC